MALEPVKPGEWRYSGGLSQDQICQVRGRHPAGARALCVGSGPRSGTGGAAGPALTPRPIPLVRARVG